MRDCGGNSRWDNSNHQNGGACLAEACLSLSRSWFDAPGSLPPGLESARGYFPLAAMGSFNPRGRVSRPAPHPPFIGVHQDGAGIFGAFCRDLFQPGHGVVLAFVRNSRDDSLRGKSWEKPLLPAVRSAAAGLPVSAHLHHRHATHCASYRATTRSCMSFMTANSLARASTSMVAVRFIHDLGRSCMSR
jgi:hypothetical protein